MERAAHAHTSSEVSRELFEDFQRRKAWESLDPDVVAHACPRGFRPFRDAIRELVATCFSGTVPAH